MPLQQGQTLPDATVLIMDDDGPRQISLSDRL